MTGRAQPGVRTGDHGDPAGKVVFLPIHFCRLMVYLTRDADRIAMARLPLPLLRHEPNEPPHVHIDAEGSRAKVWLRDLRIAKRGGFSEPDMRRIMQIVEKHREQFMEAWNDFFA